MEGDFSHIKELHFCLDLKQEIHTNYIILINMRINFLPTTI